MKKINFFTPIFALPFFLAACSKKLRKAFFRHVFGNSRSKWALAVVLLTAGCATLSIGGLTSEYPGYTITDLIVTQEPYQLEVRDLYCVDKTEQRTYWKKRDFGLISDSNQCRADGGDHMFTRHVGFETKFSDEYTVRLESPGKDKTVEEKVAYNLFVQLKVGQILDK